ncbi:putative amidohydrolase [Klebsiella pneumoniae]|uniref:Putative amidohydrolase n=1 Tax=Klebsiella pneumoniae TaxID=573 RepID=A0A3S4IL54_KLEPN|nr:putative amidohydrolase [Klebsiella pneumoniae]
MRKSSSPRAPPRVFWDPHELANVLGVAGVRYAVDASRHLPLQVMVAAPSSVPSTPGLEMSGADFAGAEMETMLGWPEVRGVAEVMDMHGVLHGSERMQEIVQAGLNSGKLIEGHARGLRGADLQAYLAAGVTSDHELTSADDALEKTARRADDRDPRLAPLSAARYRRGVKNAAAPLLADHRLHR